MELCHNQPQGSESDALYKNKNLLRNMACKRKNVAQHSTEIDDVIKVNCCY